MTSNGLQLGLRRFIIDEGRSPRFGTRQRLLKSIQRDDGSWYGSWGCCFTYAGWFGIEGLGLR